VARQLARHEGGDATAVMARGVIRCRLLLPVAREARSRTGTILLVDDNVEQSRALGELLRLEGFTIEVIASARDALSKLDAWRPDLLLLDLRLPDIRGESLLRLARIRHPGLPAIVITGYPREHSVVRQILAEERSEYISKPTDLDTLFRLVEKMIGTAATA
jgi:DNA-binding NtrC family response regulator